MSVVRRLISLMYMLYMLMKIHLYCSLQANQLNAKANAPASEQRRVHKNLNCGLELSISRTWASEIHAHPLP